MNSTDGKPEDVLQLKQLVRHLQAELNKYKTSQPSTYNEMDYEHEKLLEAHEELVYKSLKAEKRIELYEKRFKSLISQRDDALFAINQHNETKETMNVVNSQQLEALRLSKEELAETVRPELNQLETKLDDLTNQLPPLISEHFSELLQNWQPPSHPQTEKIQKVILAQQELIRILEDYVQQLSEV
ncbi:hypothetical protein DVB69_16000 [Sporosarcina sp. BI001-red]|uniref:hypothetical protein n=1 Tax=Sporosarcina sp. BI001-red TaxID=2282866 RepID=UPI000E28754A|nr:hypothetical protein [Sporosarcina sp. BI001-red]REB05255.1 hypothetical protein DVB69_16000 [Sporosarcina sp. BI001-red]